MSHNYKSREKAEARYSDKSEQEAFRTAYARGYTNSSITPSLQERYATKLKRDWPNAYGAGYWEGHADGEAVRNGSAKVEKSS